MKEDRWLSLQEVADACGVTYRTVYRGELRAEKPDGKPYRLRRGDVKAFIERSLVRPGELRSAPIRRRT